MGFCVCQGAVLQCTFGAAPSMLMASPTAKVMSAQALANIMDQVPVKNILPFGMCSNPANPAVAAATAAAMGVLTPMPCIPAPLAPWTPGSSQVLIGGKPALTSDSKLICSWGGAISINFPGTVTLMTG